ncbi:MAG: glucokinase [Thermovirgaceae bacterium]|nr:glucokinase [Thermovirgaceae bacterium]
MRKNPDTMLAGDIGGTKTNLAIFSREAGTRKPLAEAVFSSGDYRGLAIWPGNFSSIRTSRSIRHASE